METPEQNAAVGGRPSALAGWFGTDRKRRKEMERSADSLDTSGKPDYRELQ